MNAAQLREVADQMQRYLQEQRKHQEEQMYERGAPEVRKRLTDAAQRGLYEIKTYVPSLMLPELDAAGFVTLPVENSASYYTISWKGNTE